MEEKNKTIVGCIAFLLLILVIGIGGYIYTFQNDKHKKIKESEAKITEEYKKDKDKDYIYYKDSKTISESIGLIYKKPVINLDNPQADAITSELALESDNYEASIKKISETEDVKKEEIAYDTDDIYSATIRDYENYQYKEYASLVVVDSEYDCYKGIKDYPMIKSYIFNVAKNERVSNVDALAMYDTTLTEVKDKIKAKLTKDQTVVDEVETIKIDETIENLSNDNGYGLYIDNEGNLIIKYIVKSNHMNYNEIMIIK